MPDSEWKQPQTVIAQRTIYPSVPLRSSWDSLLFDLPTTEDKMAQRLNTGIVMVLVVVFAFAGCALPSSARSPKFLDPEELLVALKDECPTGIPLAAAQERMESLGFTCESVIDGTFAYHFRDDQGKREKRTRENIDFILCKRQLKQGLMVTYFETVALVLENGVVMDALYEKNSLGP